MQKCVSMQLVPAIMLPPCNGTICACSSRSIGWAATSGPPSSWASTRRRWGGDSGALEAALGARLFFALTPERALATSHDPRASSSCLAPSASKGEAHQAERELAAVDSHAREARYASRSPTASLTTCSCRRSVNSWSRASRPVRRAPDRPSRARPFPARGRHRGAVDASEGAGVGREKAGCHALVAVRERRLPRAARDAARAGSLVGPRFHWVRRVTRRLAAGAVAAACARPAALRVAREHDDGAGARVCLGPGARRAFADVRRRRLSESRLRPLLSRLVGPSREMWGVTHAGLRRNARTSSLPFVARTHRRAGGRVTFSKYRRCARARRHVIHGNTTCFRDRRPRAGRKAPHARLGRYHVDPYGLAREYPQTTVRGGITGRAAEDPQRKR